MIERGKFLMNWKAKGYGFIPMDTIAEQCLFLNDLGLEIRQEESYYFNNEKRDMEGYIFQYTLEGNGYFEVDGGTHILSPGKAFFISLPHESRYYYRNNQESPLPWTFFYLHLSGPAIKPFYERIMEMQGPVLELSRESHVIDQSIDLLHRLNLNPSLGRYEGSQWLYQFLFSLLKEVESPLHRPKNLLVEQCLSWMKTHYTSPINLEAMSQDFGVTYPHLARVFHREQGITPIQYLTHLRLEHGMNLLINSSYTIKKIAEECGFSCANYFSKVFKRALQITPDEYRKQHKLR